MNAKRKFFFRCQKDGSATDVYADVQAGRCAPFQRRHIDHGFFTCAWYAQQNALGRKTYRLPVLWLNSSVSLEHITLDKVVPCRAVDVDITKSGRIVSITRNVDDTNNTYTDNVVFDGEINFGEEGLGFDYVTVAPNNLVWMVGEDHKKLCCIDEDGNLIGVKQFPQNTLIDIIAFRGDALVVVDYEEHLENGQHYYDHHRLSFYTSSFEEEAPTKVIDVNSYILDLQVCIHTGIDNFVQLTKFLRSARTTTICITSV